MRHWFAEASMRRLLRETGVMGLGKIAGTALHLASLALAARVLGPVAFGLLVLIRGYALTVSGLAKFQSWQLVVRYGAAPLADGDRQHVADIVSFAVLLDLATGVGAALLAALLAPELGPAIGLDIASSQAAILYCLAIPTMTAAAPTGVLRLLGRFDQLAAQSVITPLARIVGLAIAVAAGATFFGILIAWLVSDLIGDLYLWVAGARELQRRGVLAGTHLRPAQAPRRHRGLWRFAAATNASATIEGAWGSAAGLLVGGLLGPAAAGTFRLAQTIFDALVKPVELASRSFYPELTRSVAAGDDDHFWRFGVRIALLSLSVAVPLAALMALGGPPLIEIATGRQFEGAAALVPLMSPGVIGAILAYPLEAMLLALGEAGTVFVFKAIATASAAAAMAFAARGLGVGGPGFAFGAGFLVLAALEVAGLARSRRRLRSS